MSLLLTPVADGGTGEPALFDVEGNHSRKAVAKLRLKSVRRAASDMLWIKYAVRKMTEMSNALLSRNGLRAEDVKLLIPHQANRRIIEATAKSMSLPLERVIINIDKFGNTTAATIP